MCGAARIPGAPPILRLGTGLYATGSYLLADSRVPGPRRWTVRQVGPGFDGRTLTATPTLAAARAYVAQITAAGV